MHNTWHSFIGHKELSWPTSLSMKSIIFPRCSYDGNCDLLGPWYIHTLSRGQFKFVNKTYDAHMISGRMRKDFGVTFLCSSLESHVCAINPCIIHGILCSQLHLMRACICIQLSSPSSIGLSNGSHPCGSKFLLSNPRP